MSDILKEIVQKIDERQGDDIEVLDFRNTSPYVDYFVICSARNTRLAASIIDEVEQLSDKNEMKIKSKDDNRDSLWQLIDLGEIVVHVFVGSERAKYNLEGLWKDLIIKI